MPIDTAMNLGQQFVVSIIALTQDADDLAFCFVGSTDGNEAFTEASGETEIADFDVGGGDGRMGAYEEDGTGATTLSWTVPNDVNHGTLGFVIETAAAAAAAIHLNMAPYVPA